MLCCQCEEKAVYSVQVYDTVHPPIQTEWAPLCYVHLDNWWTSFKNILSKYSYRMTRPGHEYE
jgi:hypothetical protein